MNEGRSWMYEPRRSKIGSFKKIVGKCKYMIILAYTSIFVLHVFLKHSLNRLIYVSYGDGEHGATVDLLHYLKKCRFSWKIAYKRVFMIEPVAKYIGDVSLWISTPK